MVTRAGLSEIGVGGIGDVRASEGFPAEVRSQFTARIEDKDNSMALRPGT
jgi:hypothetical protein